MFENQYSKNDYFNQENKNLSQYSTFDKDSGIKET